MATNRKHPTARSADQERTRQAIIDHILSTGVVTDHGAYYNDCEDRKATLHIVAAYNNTPCPVIPMDQASTRIQEFTGRDSLGDIEWYVEVTGVRCACGEIRDASMHVKGRIDEVALAAHHIDTTSILDR